jgi:hypothetical protein
MLPAWTVPLSYLASAIVLALGAAVWLGALAVNILYHRVEAGRLEQRWLDLAYFLTRNLDSVAWAGLACAAAAFVLALLPAGDGAIVDKAHKAYQLRHGAVALAFLALIALTPGRMGAFDVDLGAVVVFAWSLWIVAAGWRAWAGEAAVAGPALWWLALIADLLLLGAFAFFWIMIEIQGFRMF